MENTLQRDIKLDEIKENFPQQDVKIINNILNGIKEKYSEYTNNEIYVYKKCRDDLIVILEKFNDSRTNEKRAVFNSNYAKYRADKLKVVYIFDITDLSKRDIAISESDKSFIYRIGEVVSTKYEMSINSVCSYGIHYFKTIDAAYYYNLIIKEKVPYKTLQITKNFDDNGKLKFIEYYVNYPASLVNNNIKALNLNKCYVTKNHLTKCYMYDDNEYLEYKTKYIVKNFNYQHTIYYKKESLPIILQHNTPVASSRIASDGFNNNLISRIYVSDCAYSNEYSVDNAYGESIEYHINGQIASKVNYKKGKKHGEWVDYFDNGQLMSIGMYKKDKRVGEWLIFDFQGNITKKVF